MLETIKSQHSTILILYRERISVRLSNRLHIIGVIYLSNYHTNVVFCQYLLVLSVLLVVYCMLRAACCILCAACCILRAVCTVCGAHEERGLQGYTGEVSQVRLGDTQARYHKD